MATTACELFVILCVFCGITGVDGITLTWITPAAGGDTITPNEDVATGTTLLTLNADNPTGITYEILPTIPSEFSIEEVNKLKVVSALDYETTQSYTIVLRAYETAVPANSADVTLTINVVNVNDNGPVLASTSTAIDVKEGTTQGANLATISHTDADVDGGMIEATYALTGDEGKFILNGAALETTNVPTVFGTKSSYSLTITATDDNNAMTDTIAITITITTEPIFTLPASGGSSASKAESVSAGEVIITFAVTDEDNLPYTPIVTTFAGDHTVFEISGSGLVLKAGASFDHETTPEYTVTFTATDGEYSVTSGLLTVTITDVNEAPVFAGNTPTSAIVGEKDAAGDAVDGFLASTWVTDPEDDTITYSISGSSLLTIDSGTGALTTTGTLTYASNGPSFTATITAADPSTLQSSHAVTFNVKTAPVITLPAGDAVNINEDSVHPASVHTFAATDVDGDTTFTFSIQSQSVVSTFRVSDDNLGIIVAEGTAFQYDGGVQTYTLTIHCEDPHSQTSTAVLTINIDNVNDEDPVFTSSTSDVAVPETLVPGNGDVLYTATATDDVTNTLTYTITGGNTGDVFAIDSASGEVVLIGAVAFATLSSYTLTFTVTDTTGDTNTLNVNFNVKTPPVFTSGTSAAIDENSAVAATVYPIVTTDADGDTNPTYLIVSQTVAGAFSITASDLLVATSESLDYETHEEHTVVLSATDTHGVIGSVTVAVTINNLNDEDPVFTSATSTVDVGVNEGVGTSVYQAIAVDDMVPLNLVYAINSGNDAGYFTIDVSSGDVTTATAISYIADFSLVISAFDTVDTATITVPIHIRTAPTLTLPAGDNQDLPEDSSIGTTVYTFAVSDQDGDTSHTYSIVPPSAHFAISGSDVVTSSLFDFETGTTSFSLVLRVEDDYPLHVEETLTVTITDANDETPVFAHPTYTQSVKENIPAVDFPPTVATDADNGDSIAYSLEVTSVPPVESFQIDPATGEVTLTQALTYDAAAPTISIRLIATDGAAHQGTADLTVTVIQETNVAFADPTPAPVSIAEGSPVDYVIFTSSVTDADGDSPTFLITSNNEIDVKIENTGNDFTISTDAIYDFETLTDTVHVVTFTVTDENNVPHVATDSITVTITDINDNDPVFSPTSYTASLLESVDTDVVTVTATDEDSSLNNNNVIEYSITSGNGNSIFSIVPSTGVITANPAILIYSPTAATHTLVVTAKDLQGAAGARMDTANVVVTILTAPVWTEPDVINKAYSVPEDIELAGSIQQLAATDDDGSDTLVYTIITQTPSEPADLIELHPGTVGLLIRGATNFDVDGELPTTIISLDLRVTTLERARSIELGSFRDRLYLTVGFRVEIPEMQDIIMLLWSVGNILAPIITNEVINDFLDSVSDGVYSADTSIVINIAAVDDIEPVFDPTSYTFTINDQDPIGTSVGKVTVTDGDSSTAHNTLTYALSQTNSEHFLMSTTVEGQIETAVSMQNAPAQYDLQIAVSDSVHTVTANVIINVNRAPVWVNPPATATIVPGISENMDPAEPVYLLSATDADGDVLTYSILSISPSDKPVNAFLIPDSATGQIVVGATVLNVDDIGTIASSFTLNVRVSDGTTYTDSSVVVNVADINDNNPIFSPTTYTFSITDQMAIGSSVGKVTATDADATAAHNTISYVLSVTTNSDHFQMSTTVAGQIETAVSMQNAPTPYSLTVTASDGVTANDVTASVTINVNTVPAWVNPPATATIVPGISEDMDPGDPVYLLSATDTDGDTLTYSILSISPSDKPVNAFLIPNSATGQIVLGATVLNVDDIGSIASSFTLNVRVSDGTTDLDSSLVVNVADINDITPIFSPTTYTFNINDVIAIGNSVGKVTATDGDLTTAHNSLSYSISAGTNSAHFQMSSIVPGQIETAVSMQNAPTPYSLTVTVTDTVNSADTSVTVNVKTVPQFTHPPTDGHALSVNENSVNVYLLQSTDTDNDSPIYSIISQDPSTPTGLFEVSSSTGQIDVGTGKTLDYDANDIESSYTLGVRVSDGTTNVDSSVVINVVDLNDEIPEFASSDYTFAVSESAPTGHTVGSISATDDDSSSAYNSITYTLSGTGSTDFGVSSSGEITVNAQLDHANIASYTLTATASDTLNTDTANIVITVKTAPVWQVIDSAQSETVEENIVSSHLFFRLTATDADGDPLTYSIKTQTVTDFYKLDGVGNRDVLMNTGKELDYEANTQHTLTFEVTDGTNSPVISAQLVITVLDLNDNSPTFSASTSNIYVKDTTPVGATVTTLTAVDADSSTNNNNVITYSITSGNTNGDFNLLSNGVLTLENAYSTGDSDTITVQATDGGTPSRSGSVTLIITATTPSNPTLTEPSSSGDAVEISESLTVGSHVYTIEAADSDGDSLIYSIASPNPAPAEFRLDGNVLQVKLALDYETTRSYQIVFEIDDDDGDVSNKLTSGTLTVTITNENDHFPTFSQEYHTVEVMEQHTDVIDVLQLTCTDRDDGVAGDLTYSIVHGDYFGQFSVDTSGKLKTTNVALLRSKQEYLMFAIQCKDGGTPPLADSAQVKVIVTPLSDDSGAMFLEYSLPVVLVPILSTLSKILFSFV